MNGKATIAERAADIVTKEPFRLHLGQPGVDHGS
jgi:hypothetical protein